MEIDITSLLEADQFELSHSAHEGGQDAGRNTWQNALNRAEETTLLDTPEKLEAMREFARESGGWNAEERAAWSDQEINALFLQWIAGDVRQCPAILDGITFEERAPGGWYYEDEAEEEAEEEEEEGGWYYEDEAEEGYEYGPFATRSEAYENHTGNTLPTADSLDEIDWLEYEAQASAGRISGNLFRAEDGTIYFTLGN